jgi:hypothetical protein
VPVGNFSNAAGIGVVEVGSCLYDIAYSDGIARIGIIQSQLATGAGFPEFTVAVQ